MVQNPWYMKALNAPSKKTYLGQSNVKLFFGQFEGVLELESQLLDGDEVVVDLDGLLDLQQKLDGRRIVALIQQLLKPDVGLLLQK